MPTIELLISGKVQGVFYRASTKEKANELGLTGWVRNMPDGSVLVRASGNEQALAQLENWCHKGPERAIVTQVVRSSLPEEHFTGFTVIR